MNVMLTSKADTHKKTNAVLENESELFVISSGLYTLVCHLFSVTTGLSINLKRFSDPRPYLRMEMNNGSGSISALVKWLPDLDVGLTYPSLALQFCFLMSKNVWLCFGPCGHLQADMDLACLGIGVCFCVLE